MNAKEIGKALRKLRKGRGYLQTGLAQLISGTDAVVISRWENGEGLRRFIRHAPELVGLLGPEVWPLVYHAAETIHRRDDWEWVGPITRALTDLLREKTERVPGRPPPVTWKFQFPTLEGLAERLGKSGPLSLMDQLHLSDAVWVTDIMRGWSKGETLFGAGSVRRRRAARPSDS